MFFIPLLSIASSITTPADSNKLAASIDVLKHISPNDVDSIVRFSDLTIQYYKDRNQLDALCKINQATGYVLSKYSYFGLSEKYYLTALSLAQQQRDTLKEIDITNSLGVIWGKMGDFVKAESLFLKALLLAERTAYPEGIVSAYFKLSTVRIKQQKADESFAFSSKADSVNRKYGTHFLEIDIISNKAIVYAIRGNLDQALAMFKLAYKYAVNEDKISEQVASIQNIGLVYKEKKDYANALKYLNRSSALAKANGLKEQQLRVEVNIPFVLAEQKQYEPAEKQLLELAQQAEKQKLDDLSLEIYYNLTDIAKTQSNYKSAFDYFKKYTSLKDKQVNEQKQRALQEASVSLGLYKANAEILEKTDLLFQKERERNIIVAILGFVAILLGFLIFILFRLKRMNGRVNRKREQLAESNNVKNKLFSIIGHDLRGSQGATLGTLNLIKEGDLNEEEMTLYLDMLIKQSQSALTTLDDLLLWGKAQIKGEIHQRQAIAILPYIESVFALNSEAIHEKSLFIEAVDLENVNVFTDSNHFSFVLRNLIANAIKFTPDGGNIRIYVEDYTKRFLKICVADNGIGIDQKELTAIFSPDSISTLGTNNEVGTGLGLTLCKEFVEANDGKIWAEQNLGRGTVICFTCLKA